MPAAKRQRSRTVSSFEDALQQYRGTIHTFALNTVRQCPSFDVEDVEQELLVVLWRCVERYDASKGASFNTLFQGCARNKCITLARTAQTQSRQANLFTTSLSTEEVHSAVELRGAHPSVEDEVMARVLVDMLYEPEEVRRAVRPVRRIA